MQTGESQITDNLSISVPIIIEINDLGLRPLAFFLNLREPF